MTKFVENSKGTRLGNKYTRKAVKRGITVRRTSKLLQEYRDACEESDAAWQEYENHYCIKCRIGLHCQKSEDLWAAYDIISDKVIRMEMFSGVQRFTG